MKYLSSILIAYLFMATASAKEVTDVEGLSAAVERHEAALLSRDLSKLVGTVVFPHVQFLPDGRVELYAEQADLPDPAETAVDWRVTNLALVMHEDDIAIVRASFMGTGEREGTELGAGLWCFKRIDGQWLIYWRHYLGPDADQ